ncbi:hypothetical protein Tco_0110321 [Tanacetum coccineum]
MASFDYRLNPLYTIKECSSCGALYTTDYCCSKRGLIDKIIRERPPQNCATYGDSVDGLYCRPCAFVRKSLNEVHLKSHSSSIKTPIKFLYEVLHTLTITVVTSVMIRLTISFVNDVLLLDSQNKLIEQMTFICDMAGQIMQKKEEEKRIAEEQVAKD